MKTLTTLMIIAVLSIGCGGDGPTGPSPVPPVVLPPAPQTITVTGHLTATNGGHPLADVQAVLGATSATTDGSGSFSAAVSPTGSLLLSLTGSGIIPRSLQVAAAGTRDLAVNAIALGGQFDLNFYREFVRDSLESPALQPLRRWTANPLLYLQTGTGADDRTLNMIEQVGREAVAQWSNGSLNVAGVERGPGTRQGQAGWLTVQFTADPAYCGRADVGLSGGIITLSLQKACSCGVYPTRQTVVRHEFGHAMGYFHTDNPQDVMYRVATQCDMPMSARERVHVGVAYNRPVGNQDPDADPVGTVSLSPMRVQH